MSNKDRDGSMLDNCVKYFKDNKAYERFFVEMRKKWKKYGRPSGYIKLNNTTVEEREAIKFVIGESYNSSNIVLRVSDFEEALQETKFKGVRLQELLESYFSESMVTNKNTRLKKMEKKQKFFEKIYEEITNEKKYKASASWLQKVISEKKHGYNLIITGYEKSEKEISIIVFNVCKAIAKLQSWHCKKVRLAVLSAEVTSNPHYFDKSNTAGKLLIYALSNINNIGEPQNAEEILALYYSSGIQPDDISSYTTLYGISLYTEQGIHSAYESFIEKGESYVVTLSNLNKIVKASCKHKKVFVIENQMVFSYLCESLIGMPVSMLCTSGQVKTASLLMIDLLCTAGYKLYYSGDIDPEGIGIADKVISRCPELIIPWRMTKEDYEFSVSNEALDATRIKKLDKIKDKRLEDVVNRIRREKKAGYQELLIENLLNDIKTF